MTFLFSYRFTAWLTHSINYGKFWARAPGKTSPRETSLRSASKFSTYMRWIRKLLSKGPKTVDSSISADAMIREVIPLTGLMYSERALVVLSWVDTTNFPLILIKKFCKLKSKVMVGILTEKTTSLF